MRNPAAGYAWRGRKKQVDESGDVIEVEVAVAVAVGVAIGVWRGTVEDFVSFGFHQAEDKGDEEATALTLPRTSYPTVPIDYLDRPRIDYRDHSQPLANFLVRVDEIARRRFRRGGRILFSPWPVALSEFRLAE